MSRKPYENRANPVLRRQLSMKSEEIQRVERQASLKSATSGVIPWYASFEPRKVSERAAISSPTMDAKSKHMEYMYPKGKTSPKFLTVSDQRHSGSSTGGYSQFSQQPSFESYDSSISANSWPSSNEPENALTNNRRIRTDHQRSIELENNNETQTSTKHAEKAIKWATHNEILSMSSPVKSTDIGKSCLSDESLDDPNRENTKEFDNGKKYRRNSKKFTLKLMGNEQANEDKSQPIHSGHNFKGLWKKAFHSLMRDKGKREKAFIESMEVTESSDDIDPVYQLLRSAASKSQSTLAATSGVSVNDATKRKPGTPDLSRFEEETHKQSGNNGDNSEFAKSCSSQPPQVHEANRTVALSLVPKNPSDLSMHDQQDHAESDAKETMHPKSQSPFRDTAVHRNRCEKMLREGHGDVKTPRSFITDSTDAFDSVEPRNERFLRTKETVAQDSIHSNHTSPIRKYHSPSTRNYRIPLSHRLKSLSVDDGQDSILTGQIQIKISPSPSDGCTSQYSGYLKDRMGSAFETKHYQLTNYPMTSASASRVKLSSMKSVSLDVPSHLSPEASQVISGGSSPGQLRSHVRWKQATHSVSRQTTTARQLPVAPHETLMGNYENEKMAHPYPNRKLTRFDRFTSSNENFFLKEKTSFRYSDETLLGSLAQTKSRIPGTHDPQSLENHVDNTKSYGVYLVLHDYIARRSDEICLRSGQYVRVIEMYDSAWWYGSCDGFVGYFPSRAVKK